MAEKNPWETVYSMITELNNVVLSQSRNTNNILANVQTTLIDIKNSLAVLAGGLQERHNQRNQQEIDELQARIEIMQKQIDEKKSNGGKTSKDIENIAMQKAQEFYTQQRQAERKKWEINWPDVYQKLVMVVITAIVIYSLPAIGRFFAAVFAP